MERQAHLTYSEFMQQYVSLPLVSKHIPSMAFWLRRSYLHCLME